MYKLLIRPILFLFDPEKVHEFIFFSIKSIFRIPFVEFFIKKFFTKEDLLLERNLWGIKFKNPIGLAAGFDKDADLFNELSSFGFGFIEIGTLTPLPQKGNPKKRLFRIKEENGIINRMGFNNKGVDSAIKRLKTKNKIIIGGNIGKNKNTPNEKAVEDYKYCFNSLFPYVDYFAVNVSSPNTPELRKLQDKKPLEKILVSLIKLNSQKNKRKPILLKISPDLNKNQLSDIIDLIIDLKLDGIIATNTTIDRSKINSDNALKNEKGGLSGKPLYDRSNDVIKFISKKSKNKFPIIGVGGIHSPKDAINKIKAGATLVQIYTGFIYEGPSLIKKINREIINQNN